MIAFSPSTTLPNHVSFRDLLAFDFHLLLQILSRHPHDCLVKINLQVILHSPNINFSLYLLLILLYFGPGSSVGIVTGCGMEGPGIESRWG